MEAKDPLDQFVEKANADPRIAIAAMFWANRLANPEFTVEVKAKDIEAFQACTEYLKVTPTIMITRPQGLPAQAAIPAAGTRRAVPGRTGQPPKNYAIIQMVDADGNAFVGIENNEEDFERQQQALHMQTMKRKALVIAQQLEQDMNANITSSATQMDAVATLRELSKA